MKKFLLLFAVIHCSVFSQRSFLPTSNGEITKHTVLTISYIEEHEQAEWVYYESNDSLTNGPANRKDNFKADKSISTGSASLKDYNKYGYDRGHLAPAQDMKASSKIMSESFLLSNMSPQSPSFNRGGKWRVLEDAVHSWGSKNVIVVTGPIFKDNFGQIGKNKVTVPGYFYKAIYSPQENKMIGFVLPHLTDDRSLMKCAVPIDKIESLTGIDFFPQLEDDLESELESTIDFNSWSFTKSPKKKSTSNSSVSTQCLGISKSTGVRCKSKTKNENKYCRYHQDQTDNKVTPSSTQTNP